MWSDWDGTTSLQIAGQEKATTKRKKNCPLEKGSLNEGDKPSPVNPIGARLRNFLDLSKGRLQHLCTCATKDATGKKKHPTGQRSRSKARTNTLPSLQARRQLCKPCWRSCQRCWAKRASKPLKASARAKSADHARARASTREVVDRGGEADSHV